MTSMSMKNKELQGLRSRRGRSMRLWVDLSVVPVLATEGRLLQLVVEVQLVCQSQ
jgi:hypothetical protein